VFYIQRAGHSIGNIASTYRSLGRHTEALATGERFLEFSRRVLPENHSAIGEGHVRSDALYALC
jgi:hypothetical protein